MEEQDCNSDHDSSPERDPKNRMARELKSLMDSAKESKIISESTQISTKMRKSRKDVDSPGAARSDSVNSNSSQSTDKIDDKRKMRTQNSEFATKHMLFLKAATGAKRTSANLDSISDSSMEKQKDADSDTSLLVERTYQLDMLTPFENRRSMSVVQEVNGRKVDPFCWRCHTDETTVQCSICPRSYHHKCLNSKLLPQNMAFWACFECSATMNAEDIGKRTPAMEKISQTKLGILLKYATQRMMNAKGSEPFLQPVDLLEFPDYEKYIVHPVDLKNLHDQVMKNSVFGSTFAFQSEAKWIVHNSIIFNTRHSKLTSIAKSILKVCKDEMGEIETCPECYLNAYTKDDWFIQVCERPHMLLWAKLKSYPYWPGKAMAVSHHGLVDVRFFGAHDRAWVPIRDCFLFSQRDPNTNNKFKKNEIMKSIKEINHHINNINAKYKVFIHAEFKTPYEPSEEDVQLRAMIPLFKGPPKSYSPLKISPDDLKPPVDISVLNMQPKVVINKAILIQDKPCHTMLSVVGEKRTASVDSADGILQKIASKNSALCRNGFEEDDMDVDLNDLPPGVAALKETHTNPNTVAIPIVVRKRARVLSIDSSDVAVKKMKPIPIMALNSKDKTKEIPKSNMMLEYKDALREGKARVAEEKKGLPDKVIQIGTRMATVTKVFKKSIKITNTTFDKNSTKICNTISRKSSGEITPPIRSLAESDISKIKVYPGTAKLAPKHVEPVNKTQNNGSDSTDNTQTQARLDSLAMLKNLKMNNNSLSIAHKTVSNGTVSVKNFANESLQKSVNENGQLALTSLKDLTVKKTPSADQKEKEAKEIDSLQIELIVPKEEPIDFDDIPLVNAVETPVADSQNHLLNSLQLMPTPGVIPDSVAANIKELTSKKPADTPSHKVKKTVVKKKIIIAANVKELTVNKTQIKKYKSPADLRDESVSKVIGEDRSLDCAKYPKIGQVTVAQVKKNVISLKNVRNLTDPLLCNNDGGLAGKASPKEKSKAGAISTAVTPPSDVIKVITDSTQCDHGGKGDKLPSPQITILNHALAGSPGDVTMASKPSPSGSFKRKRKRCNPLQHAEELADTESTSPIATVSTVGTSTDEPPAAKETSPKSSSMNPMNGLPPGIEPPLPSSAGSVHKLISESSSKIADFFQHMIISTLGDLGLKDGVSPEAAVRTMQMEMEILKYNQTIFCNDMKAVTDARIEEMRQVFESQIQRAVIEAKQIAELEKTAAVTNTKLFQWCAFCHNQSQFFCCWNTSYCSYQCQQNHWVSHTGHCVQTPKNGTQEPKKHGALTSASTLPSLAGTNHNTPVLLPSNVKTMSVQPDGSIIISRKVAGNHIPQTIQTLQNSKISQNPDINVSPSKIKPVVVSKVGAAGPCGNGKESPAQVAVAANSSAAPIRLAVTPPMTVAEGKIIQRKFIKIAPRLSKTPQRSTAPEKEPQPAIDTNPENGNTSDTIAKDSGDQAAIAANSTSSSTSEPNRSDMKTLV